MNMFITMRRPGKALKKIVSGVLMIAFVAYQAALPLSIAYAQSEPKVNICHGTSSQKNPWNAIEISQSALQTHLDEGDFLYTGPTEDGKPTKDGDDWCKNNAPTPPVDVCPNIDGNQTTVPQGKEIVNGDCVDIVVPPAPSVTISATKVVCDTEADLPNWGAGGATIGATTAADWVAQSDEDCRIDPTWKFQWGDQTAPDGGAATIGEVAGYTTFTAGTTTIPLAGITEIHLREVLKEGYIPFTGQNTTQNMSAEFYCTGDALNYDNWDFIRNPQAGQTYHCVGFNAPVTPPAEPQQCAIVSDTTNVIEGTIPAVQTWTHSAWVNSTLLGSAAKWIWNAVNVVNPTIDETEVFTKQFSVTGTVSAATLEIAADNGYLVKVNGTTVVDKLAIETNYGALSTHNVASYLTTGVNTLEITVKNFGVLGSTAETNPAGLLYKLSITAGTCSDIVPPPTPQVSDVTMCKVDTTEKALSGWQLMLKGESVGAVDVLPNGNEYKILGVPVGDYIVKASGQYTYRPGVAGAEYSDAAYSKRAPTDSVYGGPFVPWVRVNDFPAPITGWLGIMLNNALTNWGSVFNPAHIYALGTTVPVVGDLSFKILDDHYGDNSGLLNVEAFKGYTGVTGENGCVVFQDVPYGTYTTDEIQKAGWENVSGLGTVAIDSPTETITIVNRDTTIAPEPTFVKVHIYKYLTAEEGISAVPNEATIPGFPMVSTWQTANLNGGAVASGNYILGNYHGGIASKYAASTSPMQVPADYTTSEVVGGESPILAPDAMCVPGKYRLVGYKKGGTLASAVTAPTTTTAPVFTDITADQYVVVVNELCEQQGGGEPTNTSNTTVVTPSALNGWSFVQETATGSGAMVAGPTTAPLGTGSAQLVVNSTGGELLATAYMSKKLSDIQGLSYSSYRTSGSSAFAPSVQINIDTDLTDANVAWQGRLVYEPYYTQTVLTGSWQNWNTFDDAAGTGTGNWWFSNSTIAANTGCTQANPCTWTEVKAALPNGGIHSTLGGIGFKAGSNWAGGFDGNVDKLILSIKTGLNTHTETYDFEPAVCSDGISNDEDGLIDQADPACHSDGNAQNPVSYTPDGTSEVNGENVTQCSDGIDNDNDGKVDYINDTLGCSDASDDDEKDPTQQPAPTGGGGGSVAFVGGGAPSFLTPQGQVLGASTSCGIYLDDYLKRGARNNSAQVKKLQEFLNNYLALSPKLPVTGFFGPQTYAAVVKFQEQENDLVLKPWVGVTLKTSNKGTGYVYKTTKTRINNIMCPELNLPVPAAVID